MSEETKKTSEEQEAEKEIPVTDGDQEEENLTPEGEDLPEEENNTPGEEAAPQDKKEEKSKTSFFGKKKKDKSEQKVEELTDRLKRTMAEFDNFRKRTEKEKSSMYIIGAKEIVEKILPVVDNFERGLAQAQEGDAFADGMKMIYKQLTTTLDELGVKPIEAVGKIEYRFDLKDEYVKFMEKCVPVDLHGKKIVVDCAEGASYYTSVKALSDLGAELVAIHTDPDGTNINANCGSTHMDELKARVVYEKADAGIAFDGDADRMLAVDEKGNLVDGDQVMAICGNYMKQKGRLKKNTIVVTIMSNLGFTLMGEKEGIHVEKTKVGDRYVLENMREHGYNIGGEQSGHVIFLDDNTTGDGLLSALHLLEVMVDTGKPLSELAAIMEVLPQALVNAKVPNHKKEHFMEYPEIADAIAELEKKFNGEGRVLIRPSGTEPLVRVMIEGKDQKVIDEEAKRLAELITRIML